MRPRSCRYLALSQRRLHLRWSTYLTIHQRGLRIWSSSLGSSLKRPKSSRDSVFVFWVVMILKSRIITLLIGASKGKKRSIG